jgi:hypothetical protein
MGDVIAISCFDAVPAARPDVSGAYSYAYIWIIAMRPPEQLVVGNPELLVSFPPPLKHCHHSARCDLPLAMAMSRIGLTYRQGRLFA